MAKKKNNQKKKSPQTSASNNSPTDAATSVNSSSNSSLSKTRISIATEAEYLQEHPEETATVTGSPLPVSPLPPVTEEKKATTTTAQVDIVSTPLSPVAENLVKTFIPILTPAPAAAPAKKAGKHGNYSDDDSDGNKPNTHPIKPDLTLKKKFLHSATYNAESDPEDGPITDLPPSPTARKVTAFKSAVAVKLLEEKLKAEHAEKVRMEKVGAAKLRDRMFDELSEEETRIATESLSSPLQAEEEPSQLTEDESLEASHIYDSQNPTAFVRRPNMIYLGICAMDKKARSKPMEEIISRLDTDIFAVVIFGDNVILKHDIKDWPVVDVLIAFHSTGFPLEKAEAYVEIVKPFVLNDLGMQRVLMDRRKVYDLMEASGIDVPRHLYVSRDGYHNKSSSGCGDGTNTLVEYDDHIECNGVSINKPFVEKPVDADDHNVRIYYPQSAGGGCKTLFRKINNRSSEFLPDVSDVRQEGGSYLYEEFVETQGVDVKLYTVGCDYGHAEARKSPAVDGKVVRNEDGKEVRFPVILSGREKEIARRIVLVFKQQICGFDLLRVQEGDSLVSYCCDVNGWSFVKNSRKYYDDCAQLLCEFMLAAIKPKALQGFSALDPLLKTYATFASTPNRPTKAKGSTNEDDQRARREPRASLNNKSLQGYALPNSSSASDDVPSTSSSPISSQHNGANNIDGPWDSEIESINANANSDFNNTSIDPISRCSSTSDQDQDQDLSQHQLSWGKGLNVPAPLTHQEELRCVIAVIRHGDRTPKQKLKLDVNDPLFLAYYADNADKPTKDIKVKARKPLLSFLETVSIILEEKGKIMADPFLDWEVKKPVRYDIYKLRHMRDVLDRWKINGLNRKLQIKPVAWGDDGKATELTLILKWGGNLTKLGETQAVKLGQRFRHESYPDPSGGGILRLHATFRHDLKIKTSDEGRVMKTAAAFAKGMLELEGELPPILVSLVHKEKDSMHMLDPSGNKEVKAALEVCKNVIHDKLQRDIDFGTDDFDTQILEDYGMRGNGNQKSSFMVALAQLRNPRARLLEIHECMSNLVDQLEEMLALAESGDENAHESGEGTVSNGRHDEALSGVKLYKGETLLELKERWRLLFQKFYSKESDVFDLTKIPDVHDNVRFDMLHNPHLGLSTTLAKLYTLAKPMADCVVPQEYGITSQDKRIIGSKMCRQLIEKIKYDLIIAKTDNQVDMRYMIDLSHSADLAINTLGRRIRTRLYFTSESHLHTLLNVMRFTQPMGLKSPLSREAQRMIREAPELCYLTQIVFRLFEDTTKDMADHRRYRIEIGFSPGATATPVHMSEKIRDDDTTRFDTAKTKTISKEMLTCEELEKYFEESIKTGYSKDESEDESNKKKDKKKDKGDKKKDKDKSAAEPEKVDDKAAVAAAGSDDLAVDASMTVDDANNTSQTMDTSFANTTINEEEQQDHLPTVNLDFVDRKDKLVKERKRTEAERERVSVLESTAEEPNKIDLSVSRAPSEAGSDRNDDVYTVLNDDHEDDKFGDESPPDTEQAVPEIASKDKSMIAHGLEVATRRMSALVSGSISIKAKSSDSHTDSVLTLTNISRSISSSRSQSLSPRPRPSGNSDESELKLEEKKSVKKPVIFAPTPLKAALSIKQLDVSVDATPSSSSPRMQQDSSDDKNTEAITSVDRASSKGEEGGAGADFDEDEAEQFEIDTSARRLAKRWMWGAIASVSLGVGVVFIIAANKMKSDIDMKVNRRWETNRRK